MRDVTGTRMISFLDELKSLCEKHSATIEVYHYDNDSIPVLDVTIQGKDSDGKDFYDNETLILDESGYRLSK